MYHFIVGKDPEPTRYLLLKDETIEKVNTYKHLGINHCNDGNLSYHISKVESKVKTISARIMQLASDDKLRNVENITTIKLIDNTINSILLYGVEALIHKKIWINWTQFSIIPYEIY